MKKASLASLAILISIGLIFAVVVRTRAAGAQVSPTPSPSPSGTEELTGRALAAALSLKEIPWTQGQPLDRSSCQLYAAEAFDGGIFCLDAALDPNDPEIAMKAWALGQRLAGTIPSEADESNWWATYQQNQADATDSPSATPTS